MRATKLVFTGLLALAPFLASGAADARVRLTVDVAHPGRSSVAIRRLLWSAAGRQMVGPNASW